MSVSWLWSDLPHSAHASAPVPPAWATEAHHQFVERLTSASPYPCHFGVQAEKLGYHSFTAIDREPIRPAAKTLARTLQEYLERSQSGAKRQSLIVFMGPPGQDVSLQDDTAAFWAMLSTLSMHDPAPWPQDCPRDTTDPDWQWCFAGQPWFVFAASPAHHARPSRNVGGCLTLIFQTMRAFEGLITATNTWQSAKEKIRARLELYDGMPIHPHLGDLTQPPSYRWRWAILPDDQRTAPHDTCPYRAQPGSTTRRLPQNSS